MENEVKVMKIQDTTANPAPLGLLGFGMTTVLLNFHNAGFFQMDSMILAMGIFYGGMAQIFAGIMEWKKNNTFGTTAFCSFGLFWLTLVGLILLPKTGWIAAPDGTSLGMYMLFWGIFTLVMFIGTLRLNRALQFVFLSLAILFFLLAIKNFTGNDDIGIILGWVGIICGLSAIYAGLAQVLNELYGKTILPVCPVKSC
jgi:uncharacterized protein